MKIGIAIVNYGEQQLIENCKKSLGIEKCQRFEIGCDLPKLFSIDEYNCNENNIGFSAANNILIKPFLNHHLEIDWIWLLNNDTTVPKETLDAIETILPTIESNIGIIGCQIRSMDNPDFIHHGGTGDCFPAGIHKTGSVKLNQLNKRTKEKWVTYASVLIRREVFETIGLLDEHMFNYYSDSDYCYRARYAGFDIVYEPSFVVYHKIGSSQNPNPKQLSMIRDDSIYFQNKWLNGKTFFDLSKELLD